VLAEGMYSGENCSSNDSSRSNERQEGLDYIAMLFENGIPVIETGMRDSKCITDIFNSPPSIPEIQCTFLHI
jgi:hypothetical protein